MDKARRLPRHVAIIMDGNGRWAQSAGLSRLEGHGAGVVNARRVVEALDSRNIELTTLYGFSTENWGRPGAEVSGLLKLLADVISAETAALHARGILINHLGRTDRLTPELQQAVQYAVDLTDQNRGMTLNLAFDYGGRMEIVEAVRGVIDAGVDASAIDEASFGGYLFTGQQPDVDLLIRTGGELRLSNFLLWQSAYAELYFTPVLWPDFDENELATALEEYAGRNRRYGRLDNVVS